VQRGEQSATDPDAYELEEIEDGLRVYAVREEHRGMIDGHPMLVTQRMTKRLIDDRWVTSYEVERTRPDRGAVSVMPTAAVET
jgi:hypothetical protein